MLDPSNPLSNTTGHHRTTGSTILFCTSDLNKQEIYTEKNLRDSWICFDQTFLGLGLGKEQYVFPARERLVSDIPAGDRNTAKPFFYSVSLLHGQP